MKRYRIIIQSEETRNEIYYFKNIKREIKRKLRDQKLMTKAMRL